MLTSLKECQYPGLTRWMSNYQGPSIGGQKRRFQKGGGEILQFALIVPVAILLIFSFAEFGIALSSKAVLANASRVAVREAIRKPTAARVKQVAKEAAMQVKNATITDGCITINPADPSLTTSGQDISVTIDCPYQLLVLSNFLGKTAITLPVKTTMRVP